jgi:hypothetical protein
MLRPVDEGLSYRLLEACGRHDVARPLPLVAHGSTASGSRRFDSDIDVLIAAQLLPGGRVARVTDGGVVPAGA